MPACSTGNEPLFVALTALQVRPPFYERVRWEQAMNRIWQRRAFPAWRAIPIQHCVPPLLKRVEGSTEGIPSSRPESEDSPGALAMRLAVAFARRLPGFQPLKPPCQLFARDSVGA